MSASVYPFPGGAYRARCTRVVDGDTADLVVDVGYHVTLTSRFRLLGINAPEMHAADPAVRQRALDAKTYLAAAIEAGAGDWWLRLTDVKPDADSFGRWLAVMWRRTPTGVDRNVNQDLVDAGLAVVFR